MTFYEMIDDLSYALQKEKLVIFVGAGVSKNSGLPSWGAMLLQTGRLGIWRFAG